MSRHDAAVLAEVRSVPRDGDSPVFPAPWAARAFALAVTLNERGLFEWREWSETLGAEVARTDGDDADPERYWRAWLAALETILTAKQVGHPTDLAALRDAWEAAAEATPHGQPIELPLRPQA